MIDGNAHLASRQVFDAVSPLPTRRLPPEFHQHAGLPAMGKHRHRTSEQDHARMSQILACQVSRMQGQARPVKSHEDHSHFAQRLPLQSDMTARLLA